MRLAGSVRLASWTAACTAAFLGCGATKSPTAHNDAGSDVSSSAIDGQPDSDGVPTTSSDRCINLCVTLGACGLGNSASGCQGDCTRQLARADTISAGCGVATRAEFDCGIPLSGCTTVSNYFYLHGGTPCDSAEALVESVCGSAGAVFGSEADGGGATDGSTDHSDGGAALLTGVSAISAGRATICALLADKTIACWAGPFGGTSYGPVAIANVSGAEGVAAGDAHACVIVAGGTVECGGEDFDGQLGIGSSPDGSTASVPFGPIPSLDSVVGISAGYDDTCALKADGTTSCWGFNGYGELGDGTATGPGRCSGLVCSSSPVAVTGISTATAISAGAYHACALLKGGTVACWGDNLEGQVGNGTFTMAAPYAVLTPTTVPGLTGVVLVSAGYQHTCALLQGGTVTCWGNNVAGQLGNGVAVAQSPYGVATPQTVPNLTGVTSLVTGFGHTCALLTAGTVECWGTNGNGQLGNGTLSTGTPSYVLTPAPVVNLSGVLAIAGAEDHTCALLGDGTVKCWGYNASGELGDGTTQQSPVPVAVIAAKLP